MILIKKARCIKPGAGAEGLMDCDILIEGSRISRIGHDLKPSGEFRVIDASGHIAIPGLVNTHHHFYQTLTRNLPAVQNAKLFTWLVYLYEIWKHLDEDGIYWSTLLASAELLKTGCTLTTDHHYLYPRTADGDIMGIQFEAARAAGIRFSPTRGSMSLSKKDGGLPPDSVVQTEEVILKDSERVIDAFHDDSPLSLSKIVLAPCSPFSVSEESMKETAALAREKGVFLHTHLAETRDENDFCLREMGRRPLQVMEDCGFTGPDVWYAHGIHFTNDELDHLARTGCGVAHCPTSNMRLGSGICRVTEMLERGINVSLAVDGSASNDSSDMLGELRNALMLQRVAKGADALTADDVLKMGTENGARQLGYADLGRLEEGMGADLALFDLDKLEYAGSGSDPFGALIFSGYNHGAAYTIVNGQVVVDKGRLTGFDEEEIRDRANAAADRLYRAGGIEKGGSRG